MFSALSDCLHDRMGSQRHLLDFLGTVTVGALRLVMSIIGRSKLSGMVGAVLSAPMGEGGEFGQKCPENTQFFGFIFSEQFMGQIQE